MECSDVCKVCPRLVISQAVTFDAGTLTINLPAGSYNNGEKYCIVVAQSIPAAMTITIIESKLPMIAGDSAPI